MNQNPTNISINLNDLKWRIEEAFDRSGGNGPIPDGFHATHPDLHIGVLGQGETHEEAQRDAVRRHTDDNYSPNRPVIFVTITNKEQA